jgi:hypothetical protein
MENPIELGSVERNLNESNGREEFHQIMTQTRFVDPGRLKHIVTNFYGEK